MANKKEDMVRHSIGIDAETYKILKQVGKLLVPEGVKPPSFNSIILKIAQDWFKQNDGKNSSKNRY